MDSRVLQIFYEEMKGDTSFRQKHSAMDIIFNTHKYSKVEMRETWDKGIKLGIEIGLRKASLEGQRIDLNRNTTNARHKEFLEKFYELAAEYKCAIQYHPQVGMTVVSRETN